MIITNHCLKRFCERAFKTSDKNLIIAIINQSREVDLKSYHCVYKFFKYQEIDKYVYNQEYKLLFTLTKKGSRWIAVTVSRNDKAYKNY